MRICTCELSKQVASFLVRHINVRALGYETHLHRTQPALLFFPGLLGRQTQMQHSHSHPHTRNYSSAASYFILFLALAAPGSLIKQIVSRRKQRSKRRHTSPATQLKPTIPRNTFQPTITHKTAHAFLPPHRRQLKPSFPHSLDPQS